jgi:hypothetical protein
MHSTLMRGLPLRRRVAARVCEARRLASMHLAASSACCRVCKSSHPSPSVSTAVHTAKHARISHAFPPRRSARMAAAASALLPSALSPLPLPLVLHIFGLLPVDARARASCVCCGWCTTLLDVSLWTRLDLSPSSGVRVRVTDTVLASAAAKARGQLAALDVSGCGVVTFDALLAVVQVSGGTLRELCVGVCATLNAGRVSRLLEAAPQLAVCHADVLGGNGFADACRMLRNEAPFQPLRLRVLHVSFGDFGADEASVLALASDLASHASLKRMDLRYGGLDTLVALDAVVDAALARQMTSLQLWACRLSPASAPVLARLLCGGTLTKLSVGQLPQLLDAPSAALLGDALRANSTLTSLTLHVNFWRDTGAGIALLNALTAHVSLRNLNLSNNAVLAAGAVAAAAYGALVAANAPALTELDVSHGELGDEGLRPLLEALPHNTHLRMLGISNNGMNAAFARDVLLPAVRANTSLRQLRAADAFNGAIRDAAAREAVALVAARAGAAADAAH